MAAKKPERMMDKSGSLKPGFEEQAGGGPPTLPSGHHANGSAETIWFSTRGTVHLAGLDDGAEVKLRFRTSELAALEKRRGSGVLSMLNEEGLGISFLRDALAVGSAHMFISKKGKSKRKLTEGLLNRWIDRCEENGITFEDLLTAVTRAVVGGLPGGEKYLAMMDEDDDTDGDDDGDESSNPPVPTA